MEINMDLDYITGRIKDAHLSGEVKFSRIEEEDFQTLLKKDLNEEELTEEEIDRLENYKEEIIASCELVIVWYDIDCMGDYHWEDCLSRYR